MRRSAFLLALSASVALASAVVPRPLDERVQLADRVVFAQVVSSTTENRGTAERPKLFTRHHVVVGENVRGTGPAELDVVQLGGTWGPWEQHAVDDAKFEVGETAVLLLKCSARGACRLAGLADAKLSVKGDDVFMRDMTTGEWSKQKVAPFLEHLKQLPNVTPAKVAR